MNAAVVQRLTQLMLLKAGPQDLPALPSLYHTAIGLFLITAVIRLLLFAGLLEAAAQAALSVMLLIIYVRSLLNWRKTPERLTQTLAALLLTGAVIGLLTLLPLQALKPALLAFAENPEMGPQQIQVPAMAVYAWLGLAIWGLVISAHIYRHALEVSLGMGVAISLLYEFLLIGVVGVLGSIF